MTVTIGYDFYVEDKALFAASDAFTECEKERWDCEGNLPNLQYCVADFFFDEAWGEAKAAQSCEAALKILQREYIGCDVDGIGIKILYLVDDLGGALSAASCALPSSCMG